MTTRFHIIGDAFVDHFCFLSADWPEKGGDALLDQPVKSFAGGSSVNTATHLKSLLTHLPKNASAQLDLHTVLNENDPFGQLLLEHAKKHDFPLINCRRMNDNSSTGHCIAIVSNGERTFMTHPGCVQNFTADDIRVEHIMEHEGDVHIHVAGFFNISGFWHGKLRDLLRHIRKERNTRFPLHSTTISLVTQHDASNEWNGGIDDVLTCLDFLIINELEATRIMQRGQKGKSIQPGEDLVQDLVSFWSPINPQACIVVTRGSQGAVAFRNGDILATLSPAFPVEVVDPTGAGDACAAGFLYGVWSAHDRHTDQNSQQLSAQDITNGLQWGCAAGTASVQIRGASVPADIESIVAIRNKQIFDR